MGQPWPRQWLEAEAALLALPEPSIDAMTYTQTCVACGVEEEIANGTLGSYLHDLGKILSFRNDDVLSNLVVLQPNWATQAIAQVLDHDPIRLANGILHHRDLAQIWTKDVRGQRYERRLYPLLFRLMERFELSYQIDAGDLQRGATLSFIPLLLPYQPPTRPPWPSLPVKGQTQVEMIYRLNFVPAGIMSRFIVRTHHYTINDLHWREGVILEYKAHRALVELNPMQREITLCVQGVLPQNFFTLLMETMDDILSRFTGLTIIREIPCICHRQRNVEEACSRLYRYEDLLRSMEEHIPTTRCPDYPRQEISLPQMLYGIHISTHDQVIVDIQQSQQHLQRQLDAFQKLNVFGEKLDHLSELIGRQLTRQGNLLMSSMEIECPNTFLLLPKKSTLFNPKNWMSQPYRLVLLCQHPHHLHPVGDGYMLRQAEEWWVSVQPWLKHLVTLLKFGVPLAGQALGVVLDEAAFKNIHNGLSLIEEITKQLPEPSTFDTMDRRTTVPILRKEQDMTGAALRALHSYLQQVDPHRIWGGLERTITPEGHLLWLCPTHRAEYESRLLQI
jgi:internalin A